MGEEEFWLNQHTMPVLFHNHPDGFAYAREETDRVDEKVMDKWSPKIKAHFPDYFQKREKWQELRKQTWEMEQDDLKMGREFQKQCRHQCKKMVIHLTGGGLLPGLL